MSLCEARVGGCLFVARLGRKEKPRCLPSAEHRSVTRVSAGCSSRDTYRCCYFLFFLALFIREDLSWVEMTFGWVCVFVPRQSHKDAWPRLSLLLATCSNVEERKKEREEKVQRAIEISRRMNGTEQFELICIWKCFEQARVSDAHQEQNQWTA